MSIAQGCVFELSSSQKGPIHICWKVTLYKDMDLF